MPLAATFADAELRVSQQWLANSPADAGTEQVMKLFQQGKGKPLKHTVFQLGNAPQQIAVLLTVQNLRQHEVPVRLLAGVPYSRSLYAVLLPKPQAL